MLKKSLSTYVLTSYLDIPSKLNIDNINLTTNNNIITTTDINNVLSGISGSINFISALSYENYGEFAKFWQNPWNYIINIITNNFPHVTTFNGLTGDVVGVSGITINNTTYYSNENPNPNLGNYMTLYDFPQHKFTAVSSYNGLTGDVVGVSTIGINHKDYSYTDLNEGIPNLGYYKVLTASYVYTFNR